MPEVLVLEVGVSEESFLESFGYKVTGEGCVSGEGTSGTKGQKS